MDSWGELVSLIVAAYAAALSTWLAIQSWLKGKTKIGIDVAAHFRLSNLPDEWRWIALEVSIRNASDRAVSLVEYGLTICHPDGTFTTAHPIHHSELPNGDSIMEDPETRERVAIEAHLDFLETPVNLVPRSSAQGWIAFYLQRSISNEAADQHPMQIFIVDQDRVTWQSAKLLLGKSKPWSNSRFEVLKAR